MGGGSGGGGSFFHFPSMDGGGMEALEPDSGIEQQEAAAGFNSPSGGMFSMFSFPQDQPASTTSHSFFGSNDAKWS